MPGKKFTFRQKRPINKTFLQQIAKKKKQLKSYNLSSDLITVVDQLIYNLGVKVTTVAVSGISKNHLRKKKKQFRLLGRKTVALALPPVLGLNLATKYLKSNKKILEKK